MRQSRHPQADLFKTTHDFAPSRRTTAVGLLKALLIEAISAQTTAATDTERSMEGNGDVEIEECTGK